MRRKKYGYLVRPHMASREQDTRFAGLLGLRSTKLKVRDFRSEDHGQICPKKTCLIILLPTKSGYTNSKKSQRQAGSYNEYLYYIYIYYILI